MYKLNTAFHIKHNELLNVVFIALKKSMKNKAIPSYTPLP